VIVVVTPGGQVGPMPASLDEPPAPHDEGTPPPPQIAGAVQVPQLAITPPHPSGQGPHVTPAGHVVAGRHGIGMPQVFGVDRPQTCPDAQVPQVMVPPQPFEYVPQLSPAGHDVRGTQAVGTTPHTLGVTAPQVCPEGHVPAPQVIEPPQPSG
jgi:hypothetical protein